MAIGSLFKKLLGAGASTPPAAETVDYNGYQIQPQPKQQGGQFVTAGIIRKTIGEQLKEQTFIRADTHTSFDDACAHSVRKAQQIIDEQGDRLFEH